MRMRFALFVVLTFASACGGSAPNETTADQLKGAPPPVAPLPTDPWAVLPDGASSVLVADVIALRSSPHGDFLKQWVKSAGCLQPEHEALLDKTQRATIAAWPEQANDVPALAVLEGSFTEADAATALDAYTAATRAAKAPVTEQRQGRIRVLKREGVAAARIGDRLLLLGTAAHVDSGVLLAEGSTALKLYNSKLVTDTGVRDELNANAIVLVGVATETMQRRAARSLGAVGMPRDLLSGTLLGVLKIGDAGVVVEARVRKPSGDAAAAAASQIQGKLGQLGLLARLAGLPPVLEHTEARADGDRLIVSMHASHADIAALRERLHDALEDQSACAP